MSEYADGFFGYFIGHESDPKGAGGIYDSATYPHLKTVIDSIRNHDTERAIVAVGNAGDTGKWTPGEQTAFRQAFFPPEHRSGAGQHPDERAVHPLVAAPTPTPR